MLDYWFPKLLNIKKEIIFEGENPTALLKMEFSFWSLFILQGRVKAFKIFHNSKQSIPG
jgi:hypothetical protein